MTTTRERRAVAITILVRDMGSVAPERPVVGTPPGPTPDIVDQWGMASFPASDPPANW
jgi:hypothetical protein